MAIEGTSDLTAAPPPPELSVDTSVDPGSQTTTSTTTTTTTAETTAVVDPAAAADTYEVLPVANPVNPAAQTAATEPPRTFTTDDPSIPSDVRGDLGPDATPEEAAAYVVEFSESQGTAFSNPAAPYSNQTRVFQHAIAGHEHDAAWLRDFYSALGADQAAQHISQSANPTNYRDWPAADAEAQIGAVRDSLVTLYEAGHLTQGDMDALMTRWTGDGDSQAFRGLVGGGDRFNSGLAQMLADTPRSADGLKNLFFDSAVGASQNIELSDQMRNDVAAAGAWVLRASGADNQVVQLRELNEQPGNALRDFTTRAMSGEKNVPTLLNSARNEVDPATGELSHPIEQTYDGMAGIVFNLAYADVGLRDRFQPPAPFTQGELSSIRQEVFLGAGPALESSAGTWDDNTLLKDGLSTIFRNEFENLWRGHLAPNNASIAEGTLGEPLESFFEHVLFTGPEGNQRDRTSAFLADTMREWTDDMRNLSHADFEAKYGVLKTQVATFQGEVLGHLSNGMERALDSAKDRQAAQEAIVTTAFDLALTLLPAGGPLKHTVGRAIGATGVNAIDSIFKKVDGDLRKQLEGMARDEAIQLLADELPGFNADQPLADLARELMDLMPVEFGSDTLASMRSAFNTIDRQYHPN